jgi:hypothetical protein
MGVEAALEVRVIRVEPHGAWNSKSKPIFATHTITFLGYMVFQKYQFPPVAVAFSFHDNHWSATAIQGERWPAISEISYNYCINNCGDLKYYDSIGEQDSARVIRPNRTPLTMYTQIRQQ